MQSIYIKEQLEHDAKFTSDFAQFHQQQAPGEGSKLHPAKVSCIEIHQMYTFAHLKHLPATSVR